MTLSLNHRMNSEDNVFYEKLSQNNYTRYMKGQKQAAREYILSKVYISTKEIQEKFDVTLMTVTRWLNELSEEGKIRKIYGGAIVNSEETSFLLPENNALLEIKRKIAHYAVSHFIKPNQTYFFEAGGTVYEMLPFIKEESITIITNSIHIVHSVNRYIPEVNVLCTGGIVRPNSMSIVGELAETTIGNFHAHTLFFGAKAVSELGLLDSDLFESVIKRKMIEQSDKVVLLADYTKMNQRAAELVSKFDVIDDIITDVTPPDNIYKLLKESNVKVHIVKDSKK